jgi:hypothetical protein
VPALPPIALLELPGDENVDDDAAEAVSCVQTR